MTHQWKQYGLGLGLCIGLMASGSVWAHGDEPAAKTPATPDTHHGAAHGGGHNMANMHSDSGGHGHGGGHNTANMHSDSGGHGHGNGHASMMGEPGNAAQVTRTILVNMGDDMRFSPSDIRVKRGETIRFFVKNNGQVEHEMVLGSLADLQAHAEQMRNMPNMAHNEPNMTKLKPGQRGGMVWRFTQAGPVDFACTVPGHLESGMKGIITVE